ncbi:MAG: hypothetical protein AAF226_16120, partial [Verrucomicrobiota bacterium]
ERQSSLSPTIREHVFTSDYFHSATDGVGNVIINLSHEDLPHIEIENTEKIIFYGQTSSSQKEIAEDYSTVIVTATNPDNTPIRDIEFHHDNTRPFILAAKNSGVVGERDFTAIDGTPFSRTGQFYTKLHFHNDTSPFVDWRMIAEFEGMQTNWDLTSAATVLMTGGIRTEASIKVDTGTLILEPETEQAKFNTLTSRNAWIITHH